MADLKKTIEIIFAGTDSVSKTLNTMSGNVTDFGNDMKDIGQPFADATKLVALLDAAIVGLAIAGVTASAGIEKETDKMVNSLGLLPEEAEKFKDVALDVYKAGYGEDMAASFEAVILAQKKLGDSAEIDIGKVTEQALKIQKTFDVDVNESLSGVKNLMTNFGLSSEEAFDFIVAGYQKGLHGSGDFIESINEYSTQFANGGADAGQFFSIMETGFSEGFLGTDRAADLFKEFRVRIQDDSKTTNDALQSLGIDPVAFGKKMASGEMTAIQAFDIIQGKLNETEDVSVQFNAGVGLMGTQFEDLGTKAALAISSTKTEIGELSGTMAKIETKTFEEKFVSALRTITTEFGKMQSWKDAKLVIGDVFTDIADSFETVIKKLNISGLEEKVKEVWDKIVNLFVENDLDLTTVEGMKTAVSLVVTSLESLATVTGGIIDILGPIFVKIKDIVIEFNNLDLDDKELAGKILGIGTALTILSEIISLGGTLIGGLGTLAGLFGTGGALYIGISGFIALLTGPAGLAVGLGAVGLWLADKVFDGLTSGIDKDIKDTKDYTEKLGLFLDEMDKLPEDAQTVEISAAFDAGNTKEAFKLIDDAVKEDKIINFLAKTDATNFADIRTDISELTEAEQIALEVALKEGDETAVNAILSGFTEEKTVDLRATFDDSKATEFYKLLDDLDEEQLLEVRTAIITGDEEKVNDLISTLSEEQQLEIKTAIDQLSFDKVDTMLEGIPEDKQVEIKAAVAAMDWEEVDNIISGVEDEKIVNIIASLDSADLTVAKEELEYFDDDKALAIKVAVNEGDFDHAKDLVKELNEDIVFDVKADIEEAKETISWFDEDGKEHTIEVLAETKGIDKAKKEIEAIPTEKMLEIKLQGEIDKQLATITAKAELVQTAMEWDAKLDIAQAEAAAEEIKAAFEAATSTVDSTAEAAASMFSDLISNMTELSTSDKWYMQDVLEDQMELERDALDNQIKLTDAQIKLMEARAKALDGGEALIQIDGTGLSPALNMVMWEIIEEVQVRANELASEFLLGI